MKSYRLLMRAVLIWILGVGAAMAADAPPAWAYGTDPATVRPRSPQTAPDTSLKHLSGSTLEFTRAQISDRFGPADWFPGDHPAMPEVVAHGRKPTMMACALCHYPNGKGRAENAGVSGLPVSYFVEQIKEFRDGDRKSADPRKRNTGFMAAIAKAMTEEEIQASAAYFGSMKWTPWIHVVETKSVPKTYTSVGLYLPIEGDGAGTEELGDRIIEVPENPEETEVLRNPRSGFVAYVPVGSIQKGKKLAAGCGTCHGTDLKGLGPVPGIAGRSPSYLVRQMYDMQQGTRKGTWTELMKPVVAQLSQEDMLNTAAYVSSLAP